MGEGFQGIFLVIIAVFWILEAIASSRRRGRAAQESELPPELAERESASPSPTTLPGRDVWHDAHDPRDGYTALPDRPTGRPMTAGERSGRREEMPGIRDRSSEERASEAAAGMVRRDLWEELAALARGERPSTVPAPSPRPGPEVEPGASPRPRAQPTPGMRGQAEEDAASRKREGHGLASRRRDVAPPQVRRDVVGSDAAMAARVRHTPALRLSVESRIESPGSASGSRRGQGALRALLGNNSPRELRRAVIIQEILGPPVALREREPGTGGGHPPGGG
jgi:hypothetical protein